MMAGGEETTSTPIMVQVHTSDITSEKGKKSQRNRTPENQVEPTLTARNDKKHHHKLHQHAARLSEVPGG